MDHIIPWNAHTELTCQRHQLNMLKISWLNNKMFNHMSRHNFMRKAAILIVDATIVFVHVTATALQIHDGWVSSLVLGLATLLGYLIIEKDKAKYSSHMHHFKSTANEAMRIYDEIFEIINLPIQNRPDYHSFISAITEKISVIDTSANQQKILPEYYVDWQKQARKAHIKELDEIHLAGQINIDIKSDPKTDPNIDPDVNTDTNKSCAHLQIDNGSQLFDRETMSRKLEIELKRLESN
jgi:hypothetical protein